MAINPEESEIVPTDPSVPGATVPAVPVPTSSEGVAESYVHQELQKARKSLRVTQIFSVAIVLGTLIYLGYITSTVRQSLSPPVAAEIADGLITEKVTEQGQTLAQQTREQVPHLIAQMPDYAIKEMPTYRAQLESQIENDMRTHFGAASEAMDGHIDDFLTANKTQIGQLLKDGQDRQATKQLGGALETEFYKYLKETPVSGNETAQQKLDQTTTTLQQIDKKIAYLAANKGLTPAEKKLRHAIAIMSGNINKHVKDNHLAVAKLPM